MIFRTLRRLDGWWWMVLGVLFFLGTSISSIIRSLEPMSFGNLLYLAIDWFAACIIYFFIGGLFGHAVDWWRLRKQITHPLWVWLSLVLWIGSSVLAALLASPGQLSAMLIVIFPLAYGVFFPGVAFSMLVPTFVQKTVYGKLFLDIVYLGVFAGWLTLTVQRRAITWQRVLLGVLFGILLLGAVGCAQMLS